MNDVVEEAVSTSHQDFQRSYYDEHYVKQATVVRDQLAHPLFSSFWDRLADKVLDLALPSRAGSDVLRIVEPACGEGFLGAALERMAERRQLDLRYTGSDLSTTATEIARSAVRGTLLVGDATESVVGMPAASQDVVVAKNLLHHIDDPESFLRAASRVVGPDGRVVIIEARLACPQCFAISLLDRRRERYFFKGRQRNLAAFDAAGLELVSEERFGVLPYEIAFHIRPAVFRRLFSFNNPRTMARIGAWDQRLDALIPWMTHYAVWVAVPAR
ncbi:MAG: class I SAM-dependent methyltransferase [Actinobacteria bacterium]|nr:class I SAM-dependent methyltransferase [Actinomycetota bacterium]